MFHSSASRPGVFIALRQRLNGLWEQNLTDEDAQLLYRGLNAQARMLPHALIFFALGLPLYFFTLHALEDPVLMLVSVVLFAVNWALFYHFNARIAELRALAEADSQARPRLVKMIFWRQGFCAFLWAVTLNVLSLMAIVHGETAHIFLFICAGAAIGIAFFNAPVLMFLLTLAPLACVGPIVAMQIIPTGAGEPQNLLLGALAFGVLMAFILNRHLVQHYKLEEDQIQLYQERESALEASRAVNETKVALIETLSREVLTGLRGLEFHLKRAANLLPRAPAPRTHVDSALNETLHLQSIIVTTLDNDTATSGLLELEIEPLNLQGLLRELEAKFEPQAALKGLEFSLQLHAVPTTGAAMGDPARVRQILTHLLSNAIQYTQKGRVELILAGRHDDYIRIQVVDSGAGLEPAEIERAFKPYQRIVRTSTGIPGAGLGLSLSAALSALMGAHLRAESTPDVGSKFWLDLPYDPEATAPAEPEPEDDAEPRSAITGMRVLLIANDGLKAAQVRDALEQGGHRCLTATSTQRALSLARKAEIDACVLASDPLADFNDADERKAIRSFADAMRATQSQAHMQILALLPEGEHAETLQAIGIDPLLWPLKADSLNRALLPAPATV
jgi:two-component system, sensor histidine kinase